MGLRTVYLILFFVSLIELIIFYTISANKINKNYLMLYCSTILSNFGYTLLIYSSSLSTALMGDLLSYIGSIFTIVFVLILVADMCNCRFPVVLRLILFIFALTFSVLIGTTRQTNLFFVNPQISRLYDMTVIIHKIGPAMAFYIIYLGGVNLAAISIVIHAILTKRKVSKVTLWILLCMLLFGTLIYVIPMMLGVQINFMPFTYVLMESIFIFFTARADTYDLPLNLMNVYKNRGGYGYIAFDNRMHLLGCDDFALSLFPELDTVAIDSVLSDSCSDVIKKIHYKDSDWNWLEHTNKDFSIVTEKQSAIATIHPIMANKKRIGYLIELRDDTEQQNYIKGINTYNKELARMIGEKTRQVTDMQDSIIKGMAIMVESRDNSTGGHILRTSDTIQIFADELLKHKLLPQITTNFCKLLIKAAPMHDLGKIAVDDSILRKPGKFTPEEYEEMKKHAAEGAGIVKKILGETNDPEFEKIAVNVAHYHHEKWDGTGYPEHLHGEEIPLEARIMALADVFDALVSKRCYKDAKSFDEAFDIIKNDLGKHFDPVIGQAFIDCRPQLEMYYRAML